MNTAAVARAPFLTGNLVCVLFLYPATGPINPCNEAVVILECFQGLIVPIRYLEVVSKAHIRLDSCVAIRFKMLTYCVYDFV